MSTFKKVLQVCAVEVMVGLGFLITGVLCLIVESYDGALVCAAVATVAGVIARMQWNKRPMSKAEHDALSGGTPYCAQPDLPAKPKRNRPKSKPSKPRRVVKAKKKTTRKK